MDVLVPIDASEASGRALDLALRLVGDGDSLHVVHISDAETDATEQLLAATRERLDGTGIEPELVLTDELDVRPAGRVGKELLSLAAERGIDHLVMGHSEGDAVEDMMLGSAAKTVVRASEIPVTVVP